LRTSADPATLQLVAAFDPRPVLAEVDRLRDALTTAGYTVDAIAGLLGPVASAALGRSQTTPALLGLGGDRSALATLVRLWPLQSEVDLADLAAALPGLVGPLAAAGIAQVSGSRVRALVDIRPYGDEAHDWWVVCDLLHSLNGRSTPVPADHVPGVGGATTSLAQLTVRRPVGTALDLGTGCGVQAFHLTAQAGRVVATDVNRRALDMARLATALNGLADAVEYREGDFFAPVAGQRFDQVVSNPPFVVSPATADSAGGGRFAYRDAGFAGDELGELLLSRLPDHLAPGGTGQLLANWEHRSGADWRDRVGSWLAPLADAGADVWALQREVLDPAAYAETWLRDAAADSRPDYAERYAAWLRDFADRGVEGIGFGWVSVHAAGHGRRRGTVRIEEHAGPVAQPLGPAVGAWFDRVAWLAGAGSTDAGLLAARLAVAPGVDEQRYAEPGADDPRAIVLRQHTGLLRSTAVDTAAAGLVGACDGTLPVGAVVGALAELLGVDDAELRAALLPRVRRLVDDGYLEPVGD